MASNQKEGSFFGIKFDRECNMERSLNDKVDGFGDEKGELYDHKDGKADKGFDDLADLLPPDPFNMEISSKGKGVAAITGFQEEWENDFGLYTLGFKGDEAEVSGVRSRLFGDLEFILTDTTKIHQDTGLQLIGGNGKLFRMNFKEGLNGGHLMDGKTDSDMDGDDPSDALLLALGYLGLGDLLAVESVCKSLRAAVLGDPLLWKSIHIDQPFCTKITDDILLRLTNRAQGHLDSLSLYHCSKITDVGLKHVLERNPSLTKLSVPVCAGLTIDGILSNLKVLKAAGKTRLKYLGINGVFGVTNQHIEEIELLIGGDNSNLQTTRTPRFFGGNQLRLTSDDGRAVDVEVCPKCQKPALVYDCPSESCQKKQSATQLCRACTVCIARCSNCGCCLDNRYFEESLPYKFVCLDCCRQRSGGQEWEQRMPLMPKRIVDNHLGYHFYYLHGRDA